MFAAGLVWLEDGNGGYAFGGSCGALMSRDAVLTADHCVPDGVVAWVQLPGEDSARRVLKKLSHPASDIALLHLYPSEKESLKDAHFVMPPDMIIDAGDFVGMGYPAEGSPDGRPVARTVKGHFQRHFGFQPIGSKDSYFAYEMNIPAPGGLSGAVLAYRSSPRSAVAVVTTNVESAIVVERTEEVLKDGSVYRERVERVVQYGIAAALAGHDEWLEQSLKDKP